MTAQRHVREFPGPTVRARKTKEKAIRFLFVDALPSTRIQTVIGLSCRSGTATVMIR